MVRLAIELQKISRVVNVSSVVLLLVFAALGLVVSPWFHIGTALFAIIVLSNIYLLYIQVDESVLRNFGLLGQLRYMMMSIGPELRQYFFALDNEEKPFDRTTRMEVYSKAANRDSSSAFGSLDNFDHTEIKLRHSMYPLDKEELDAYKLTFGEERGIKNTYTITKPIIISAMSYGALGENAVRALSRGAKKAGIPMNTGEGGIPKYHLMEGSDIIFQMGTAKFGVRNDDHTLNEKKLKELCKRPEVKMVEIKFSQGAKPGKGGLLPKEKVTPEISELRHVPMGKDVISPTHHVECTTPKTTVEFIKKVQEVSGLPVGIKMCIGCPGEFRDLVKAMKKHKIFPDYISIDGAEGGTGAAPKSFMDDVGTPIFPALHTVQSILVEEKIRDKVKLLAAGKLVNPGKQLTAMAMGADAIYTARGFMLALGCIQALQCNKNICPVGITTHDKRLQRGLVIEDKAVKVENYVMNLDKEFRELLSAAGVKNVKELREARRIYVPQMNAVTMHH